MAYLGVPLNPGSGGSNVSVYSDTAGNVHQAIVIQTQQGTNDPVTVSTDSALPVGGNVADAAADAGSTVKVGGVFTTAAPTYTNGARGPFRVDANGNMLVNVNAGGAAGGTSSTVAAAVPGTATAVGASDGTNLRLLTVDGTGALKVNVSAGGVPAGQDNTSFTAGTTQGLPAIAVADNTNAVGAVTQGNQGTVKMTLSRALYVAPQATPIGGYIPGTFITTASTNINTIKASTGTLGGIEVINPTATIAFLKVFTSSPTLGTTVPVLNIPIPANTSGAGVVMEFAAGRTLSGGIYFAVTGAIALLDSSVGPAGVAVNYGYI